MASADFTVATPSPTAGGQFDQLAASQSMDIGRINTDRSIQQQFLTSQYQRQMPQLQSQIAANGQYYSSARQRDEGQAAENFLHGSYDIQSAAQRQLDDLTRQRMMAALGLVI